MEQPKYTSCLRPLNTELLVRELRAGKAINLVGHPEAGRERMLDDIQACVTTVKHIRLNMKNYAGSYNALLESIADQMGITFNEKTSLGELVGAISRESVKCFILIDYFDAVLDNPELDSQYTRSFFDTLNSFKNKPNISLLCATEKPHEGSSIYINGKDNGASWLNFTTEGLLDLDQENIQIELDRQLADNDLWKNTDTDTRQFYINGIFSDKHNYDFLCYVAKRFKSQNSTDIHTSLVADKVKRWRKGFKELQPEKTPIKRVRGLRKWIKGWGIVLRGKEISKWIAERKLGSKFFDLIKLLIKRKE